MIATGTDVAQVASNHGLADEVADRALDIVYRGITVHRAPHADLVDALEDELPDVPAGTNFDALARTCCDVLGHSPV